MVLIFIFLSILVYEIPICTFLIHFWVDDLTKEVRGEGEGGVKTSKFWENAFKNEILVSSFPLLLTFIFLSKFVHEIQVRIFLTQFWVNDVNTGVKRNFCESDMFHKILISIFPSLSTQDIQLWALFTQFGNNDVKNE